LKYLDWPNFTGQIKSGGMTVGSLSPESAIKAKKQALTYCFGCTDEPVNRSKSMIGTRLFNGNNLIIGGPKGCGKSLLACLVLKEVLYYSYSRNKDITIKWLKYGDLVEIARWDSHVDIDSTKIMALMDTHFLVIDGLDFAHGGHNAKPDLHSLNRLFSARQVRQLPTILICSKRFLEALQKPEQYSYLEDRMGEEFVSLATDGRNTIIKLDVQEVSNA
jgi:DNA replication protein DnaC